MSNESIHIPSGRNPSSYKSNRSFLILVNELRGPVKHQLIICNLNTSAQKDEWYIQSRCACQLVNVTCMMVQIHREIQKHFCCFSPNRDTILWLRTLHWVECSLARKIVTSYDSQAWLSALWYLLSFIAQHKLSKCIWQYKNIEKEFSLLFSLMVLCFPLATSSP